MNSILRYLLIGAFVACAVCLRGEIELVGVSTDQTGAKVGLVDTVAGTSAWVSQGGRFGSYTFLRYEENEKTVVLVRDGSELRVKLKESKITPEPAPSSPLTTTDPSEYVIKPGDSALKIARSFGITVEDLRTLNPGTNWSKLRVGQKIRIK